MIGLASKYSALLLAIAALPSVSAVFDCSNAVIDGTAVNLTAFSGARTIAVSRNTPPTTTTTTWTLDLCAALQPNDENVLCAAGTQVCGVQRITIENQDPVVTQIVPVSGDVDGQTGTYQAHKLINADNAQDGQAALHVQLEGGKWGDQNDLSTSIDFVCDSTVTDSTSHPDKIATDGTDTEGLTFKSWDEKTLNLEWRSAAVCNEFFIRQETDQNNTTEGSSTALTVIKYIIIVAVILLGLYFGYTAYSKHKDGASGVDLLPSSQTILDIPYVAKDFVKKIGGGFSNTSRDGYAVF
ncbi:autophagy-related protein 27 [Lipomyces japonicus]|uniref:autophagy-related protein 27 n=1 Tax=Lipomyces japonicus TaxID=56871 RepID=UPI0034CD44B0